MILSRSRNFLFLRIPKTGSTSVAHHLISNIPESEIDSFYGLDFLDPVENVYQLNVQKQTHKKIANIGPHSSIEEILKAKIIKQEELNDIDVYATIREPVDRFISIIYNLEMYRNDYVAIPNMVRYRNQKIFPLTLQNVVDKYLKKILDNDLNDKEKFFLRPQSQWLRYKQIKIVKYPTFETFFKIVGVDDSLNFFHQSSSRKNKSTQINEESLRVIMNLYKNDFDLWNQIDSICIK